MRRLRLRIPILFIVGTVLLALSWDARACPIVVQPIWETIDEASWFGVLDSRCEAVALSPEERAEWFRNLVELEIDLEEAGNPDADPELEPEDDPLEPPASVLLVVEWKAARTISGNPVSIPDARSAAQGCEEEGRQPSQVVALSAQGWPLNTPFSIEPYSEKELEAALAWVERAVSLRSKHGTRLNDGHRADWIVDGIVDPATRRIALRELVETGWLETTWEGAPPSPLGSTERDRILRAFVRDPDVEETLPTMLMVLRGEPSLAVDLAVVDAMDAEFARLEARERPVRPWVLRWTLTSVMERLGVEEARARVDLALRSLENPGHELMREIWREARCERGYAARVECEPDPASAQPDPPQP